MRHDIPAVLRLRGWAAARQLDHASCGAAREQAERDYFTVQHTAIEQAFFWEGVGEALVSRPDWCARPTGPFGPTWTGPVAAALARVTGEDPAAASAALRGLAAGALEETDGVFADLERAFPRGPARRAMCVAAGRWGYLSMRIVELREWLDASHACDEAEVAAGWGQALARDRTVFELPDQRPPFSLWWLHASLRSEEAFVCAWRAEQDNVAALVLGDPAQDPSPIDACLPPLSAPPEERIDGDRPGVD
jgi:hypothetical protein